VASAGGDADRVQALVEADPSLLTVTDAFGPLGLAPHHTLPTRVHCLHHLFSSSSYCGPSGLLGLLIAGAASWKGLASVRRVAADMVCNLCWRVPVRVQVASPSSLLTHGAPGNTPLIQAARCGHGDVIRVLAEAGADLDHRNKVFHVGCAVFRPNFRDRVEVTPHAFLCACACACVVVGVCVLLS
jgi:hypothetical protein